MPSISIDKLSSLKTIMGMKYIYPVYNVYLKPKLTLHFELLNISLLFSI